MATRCRQCGQEVPQGVRMCPLCGAEVLDTMASSDVPSGSGATDEPADAGTAVDVWGGPVVADAQRPSRIRAAGGKVVSGVDAALTRFADAASSEDVASSEDAASDDADTAAPAAKRDGTGKHVSPVRITTVVIVVIALALAATGIALAVRRDRAQRQLVESGALARGALLPADAPEGFIGNTPGNMAAGGVIVPIDEDTLCYSVPGRGIYQLDLTTGESSLASDVCGTSLVHGDGCLYAIMGDGAIQEGTTCIARVDAGDSTDAPVSPKVVLDGGGATFSALALYQTTLFALESVDGASVIVSLDISADTPQPTEVVRTLGSTGMVLEDDRLYYSQTSSDGDGYDIMCLALTDESASSTVLSGAGTLAAFTVLDGEVYTSLTDTSGGVGPAVKTSAAGEMMTYSRTKPAQRIAASGRVLLTGSSAGSIAWTDTTTGVTTSLADALAAEDGGVFGMGLYDGWLYRVGTDGCMRYSLVDDTVETVLGE